MCCALCYVLCFALCCALGCALCCVSWCGSGVVQCVAACACRVWWVRDFCYLPVSVVIWADGDNVENRGSPFFGQAVLGVVCVCM